MKKLWLSLAIVAAAAIVVALCLFNTEWFGYQVDDPYYSLESPSKFGTFTRWDSKNMTITIKMANHLTKSDGTHYTNFFNFDVYEYQLFSGEECIKAIPISEEEWNKPDCSFPVNSVGHPEHHYKYWVVFDLKTILPADFQGNITILFVAEINLSHLASSYRAPKRFRVSRSQSTIAYDGIGKGTWCL